MNKEEKVIISVTFGDGVESYLGSEIVRTQGEHVPLTEGDLISINDTLKKKGFVTELHRVCQRDSDGLLIDYDEEPALLIVRSFYPDHSELFNEINPLNWDTMMFSRYTKTMIERKSRSCLCFSDKTREPSVSGGREYDMDGVGDNGKPLTHLVTIRNLLLELTGRKLFAEANRYEGKNACIPYHTDSERSFAICLRLGNTPIPMDISFLPFDGSSPIGTDEIHLIYPGDMYFMSTKCSGGTTSRKKQNGERKEGYRASSKIPYVKHSAGVLTREMCEFCPFFTHSVNILHSHIDTIHGGIKCQNCGKNMTSRSASRHTCSGK